MRIVITGGAGFVGSHLSLLFARANPDAEIIAFDNLHRRGSELALGRLQEGGVTFRHGDVRNPEDLDSVGDFDLLIECSAEPSVQAGYSSNPRYVVQTNLVGTVNCLEACRRHNADVVFLSTSRVYPIQPLRSLPLERSGNRLVVPEELSGPGWSAQGITTEFPMSGSRSLYGATKLCSEHLIEEYRAMYGFRAVVNRCGVITGPWQMGKVDQGFFVLWAARHLYAGELAYTGFEGEGLQVRDVLHVEDLYELVRAQLQKIEAHDGKIYNVGGGPERSVSLLELTELCARQTGHELEIRSDPETHPSDVPYYVSDNSAVSAATGWQPSRTVDEILAEVLDWLALHQEKLEPILG